MGALQNGKKINYPVGQKCNNVSVMSTSTATNYLQHSPAQKSPRVTVLAIKCFPVKLAH